jgi:hypothetical protein
MRLKNIPKLILFAFIASMALRLTLAFLNREANDSHIEVINWIVDKHELPEKSDCWQCYQLKFFHLISAGIIKLLGLNDGDYRIIAIQLLNVLIGFFTLLIFWKFIDKYSANEKIKIIVFSFFAFNPCLIGINIQATNDTLEIFSGVLVIYFTDLFLTGMRRKHAMLLILSLVLAALTKTTGLVLFAIVSLVFLLKIFSLALKEKKILLLKYYLLLLIVFSTVVPFVGGYYTYYTKNKSLPTSAWENDPPPLFYESTPLRYNRPGVRNMAEGFFTFMYLDMIRQPYINNESDNFPLHRTSLWSQLYGRTVFMHFDQWPPSWQTQDATIVFVGRLLIALGVIPLGLFLLGLFQGLLQEIKGIKKRGTSFLGESNNYIHVLTAFVFLACSLKYSYDIRDFSAMKSIYILPALISYINLFTRGFSMIRSRILINVVSVLIIVVIALSIFDSSFLIYQLYTKSV